jgi:hypothetical protein
MLRWILNLFTARKLRSQANLPFALGKSAKSIASSYALDIIEDAQDGFLKLQSNFLQLQSLNHEVEMCYYHKDDYGIVEKLEKPLATHGTITKHKNEKNLYLLGFFVFLVVETALFYMISQSISGGLLTIFAEMGRNGEQIAMIVFSVLFASISAFILDTGLEKVYNFLPAKEHFQNNRIKKSDYQTALIDFALGIFLIIMVVAILITINMARSFAIDGSSTTHNPYLVTALIFISFVAGIWMGVAKRALKKASIVISLFEHWSNITSKMKKVYDEMAKQNEKLLELKSRYMLIAYQLTLDAQEIFGKEYDDRDAELMDEYRAKVKAGKFHLNDLSTWEYKTLSANEQSILNYMIANNERVQYLFNEAASMMQKAANFESNRMSFSSINNKNHNSYVDMDDEIDNQVNQLIKESELTTAN